MSANSLLGLLIQILFILLGVVTIGDYLRHKDKTRRDIALMFGALGLTFFVQIFTSVTGIQSGLVQFIGTAGLISQPYFLLRLVRYFRPVPKRLMQTALICMIVLCVLFAFAAALSRVWQLVGLIMIIAYFAAINGYAMFAFIRAAMTTTGVVRQRMRFAAAGSGFLGATLLGLGAVLLIAPLRDFLTTLTLCAAIAAALSYYVGFVPPHWLRRAWQLAELRNLLLEITSKPLTERLDVNDSLGELCRSATSAVGGMFAAIARWDERTNTWDLSQAGDYSERLSGFHAIGGIVERVQQQRTAMSICVSSDLLSTDRLLLECVSADTLLVAPIVTAERIIALLMVFQKNSSLFIKDDLELITLVAQQSAMFLENSTLIVELQKYSDLLEAMVDERTRELRESREEVLKANEELEQRVVERTAQLSAVNRELEAFSYSVSHDLRSPLRALDGFSLALLEDYGDKLDSDGQNFLNRIRAASQRMGQLIDALLQLARLSRAEMQFKQINLSELVQTIREDLREQNPNKPVEFIIKEDLVAKGDEGMLRAALTNLVNNAWKFSSKQPQPCVEFGVTEVKGKKAYYVRDNGVGFDMAYADKLFGAFQRLHGMTEFEGTGIGLATVQRILHRHGGEIWADAAVNKGATFYFTL